MNVQATKLELIRTITDTRNKRLLERLKQVVLQAELEAKPADIHVLSEEETQLLSVINKGLPEEMDQRFMELQHRQKEHTLSQEEHQELMDIVDSIEALEAVRLENMIALASLWDISVDQLRNRLGIQAPEPHVW